MNASISLQEKTATSFLIKDITGINNDVAFGQFISDDQDILWSNPRPQDIIFLDFIKYNKLGDTKMPQYSTYTMRTNADYYKYVVDYECDQDGWYTISHLYIYSSFYLNFILSNKYLVDGTYYCYNNGYTEPDILVHDSMKTIGYEQFAAVTISNREIVDVRIITPELIYQGVDLTMMIGVEENIFCMGRIEQCFENKLKAIVYQKLESCSGKCKNSDPDLVRDRDMIWMALELLKYLVRFCKYYEAQRILEKIGSSCNGFCRSTNSIDKKFTSNCNCGR